MTRVSPSDRSASESTDTSRGDALRVDVFADVACPWCYVGERRLAAALARRPWLDVEWRWHPFQLQPDLPPEGVPWDRFVERRFGGMERARPMFDRLSEIGADVGIDFAWDRMAGAVNTADAHRAVLFARTVGRERETAEALFRAYFEEGRDVGDRAELARVGAGAGLDGEALRAWLAGDAGRDEVRASQEEAARLGVSGVPFYVFDGRLAFSGAQEVETFLQVIDRAMAERDG